MRPTTVAQPTLWRTCRVLANRPRLRILELLLAESPQTVSALALRGPLPLSVASQYLRALEARGLLTSRRTGRRVDYRLSATLSEPAHTLRLALRSAFRRDPPPMDLIFKLATAFTHPRRIEIFRTLKSGARTLEQIQAATRISLPALIRHLRKLKARGFVAGEWGARTASEPPDGFGRALARLAGGELEEG